MDYSQTAYATGWRNALGEVLASLNGDPENICVKYECLVNDKVQNGVETFEYEPGMKKIDIVRRVANYLRSEGLWGKETSEHRITIEMR